MRWKIISAAYVFHQSFLSSPTFYHVLSSPHNLILDNDASHLFFYLSLFGFYVLQKIKCDYCTFLAFKPVQ